MFTVWANVSEEFFWNHFLVNTVEGKMQFVRSLNLTPLLVWLRYLLTVILVLNNRVRD